MAKNTSKQLRSRVIYSVYVRNHTEEGTFRALEKDLERIKDLGTDIIWLMPIHEVGEIKRKGSLGSPYAIKDYRSINHEYGTMVDFESLIAKANALGMKIMIDVVFNHTSPDSVLVKEHPEYFYRKPDGAFGNKVGDWSDIIDLDFRSKELWDELIDVLKFWVNRGVDGFRCDVAPLVPLDFWLKAREEVESVKEGVIWLAESVHPHFMLGMRKDGFTGLSDSEIFEAFDISYEYDTDEMFKDYLSGKATLQEYITRLGMQEYIYPDNYLKLRFLENHDQARAADIILKEDSIGMWTAFKYFHSGTMLLYSGQEAFAKGTPSLFEKDTVDFSDERKWYLELLRRMKKVKEHRLVTDGHFSFLTQDNSGVIGATYERNGEMLTGIFNVEFKKGTANVNIPDGNYLNLTSGEEISVIDGKVELLPVPVILEYLQK